MWTGVEMRPTAAKSGQMAADHRAVMGASDQRVDTVARLTGLLEVTRLVRSEGDLDALLPAVAAAISDAMGFGTVVISLYRPAFNDFRVETVYGSEEGREALLGRERMWPEWEPLFDLRFERHGCFFLPWDEFDWSQDTTVSFIPDMEMADGPDAWHPEDALFVPLRHSQGHVLGIISVDEPISGRRPSDDDLAVLSALAAHAAQAVQDAQATAQAERHRTALEQLLRVSSRLTETLSIDALMREVCEGIRAALGFGPEHTVAAVIARLEPQKGQDVVIEVASRLRDRFPALRWLLVGGGSAEAALRAEVVRRDLADRVIFTGFRTDSADLLRASDLSVLVSTKEGLSNTLLESLVAGLPVVASRVGGNAEVVAAGAGLLVPPRDANALAHAVETIAADPAGAVRMGARGREHVRREFTVARMADQTAALWDELLGLPARATAQPAADEPVRLEASR